MSTASVDNLLLFDLSGWSNFSFWSIKVKFFIIILKTYELIVVLSFPAVATALSPTFREVVRLQLLLQRIRPANA